MSHTRRTPSRPKQYWSEQSSLLVPFYEYLLNKYSQCENEINLYNYERMLMRVSDEIRNNFIVIY